MQKFWTTDDLTKMAAGYLVLSHLVYVTVYITLAVIILFVCMFVVDQLDIATANVGLSHQFMAGSVPADAPWPHKLENAQTVIFCKEVFAQVTTVHVRSSLYRPSGKQCIRAGLI